MRHISPYYDRGMQRLPNSLRCCRSEIALPTDVFLKKLLPHFDIYIDAIVMIWSVAGWSNHQPTLQSLWECTAPFCLNTRPYSFRVLVHSMTGIRSLDFKHVSYVVLDEADRMLAPTENARRTSDRLPSNLLFEATPGALQSRC